MAQDGALYHVSMSKYHRHSVATIQFPFLFSSEVQTFLVSQFYYGQNIDALLVTFDRFAAVYGMLKNMKVFVNVIY